MLAGMLVPLLVLALAQPEAASRLIAAAQQAQASGDQVGASAALAGLASLGVKSVPEDLRSALRDVESELGPDGRFRLFASRVDDRVRVGLSDPAGLVGRVDVFAVESSGRRRLYRSEHAPAGRREYYGDPPLAAGVPVIVEAWVLRFGPPFSLKTIELKSAAAPAAPSAEAPAVLMLQTKEAVRSREIPWWVWAGCALAAGLTGLAVAQELRF